MHRLAKLMVTIIFIAALSASVFAYPRHVPYPSYQQSYHSVAQRPAAHRHYRRHHRRVIYVRHRRHFHHRHHYRGVNYYPRATFNPNAR